MNVDSPFIDSESGDKNDFAVIDKFSFLLPCKAFKIKYTVSKGYGFPVTYEFILRFLEINGPTKIESLSEFFGFTPSELAIELDKLINEGYIGKVTNQNEVYLTRQGKELFIDGKPEIVKTENIVDKFSVELLSFNLIKPQRSPYRNAFINLKLTNAEAQKASQSNKKVKESFQNGYYQYIDDKNQDEAEFRSSIRKIDSITTLYDFPSELRANLELKLSPTPELELQLPRLQKFNDPSKILRVIRRAASDILSDNNNTNKDNVSFFTKIYEDENENLIKQFITKDNRFLFLNYLKDVFIKQIKQYRIADTQPILGSPLIGQNFQAITNLINISKITAENDNNRLDLLWLRPSYPFWARSKDSVENLNITKRGLKVDENQMILLADKRNSGVGGWDAKRRYKYYFDSIIEFENETSLENIEMIILLNKFVCAVYYHNIRGYIYRIPFGLISTNKDVVIKFQNYLRSHLENRLIIDLLDENTSKNKLLNDIFSAFDEG